MFYGSQFYSLRRLMSLFGALLAVFGGVYFFNVAAKTDDVQNAAEQDPLILGRLAFSSRDAGPTAPVGVIFTANPDGSGRTPLPSTLTQFAIEPAWSPDGTKIAFAATQSPNDIYVANADGTGQINLTNTTSIVERNPSWSATGKIAYERSPQIWTMNPDGTGQAQFTAITQPSPSAPAWSPDGTKLAFSSSGEIWVINADGTNERRLTMTASSDTDPAWSPDGTKIVFSKDNNIAVINADGTNESTIATSGIQPSWSPDGTKIAFRRSGIFTMDANGANQVRIVADNILFPQCCDTVYEHPAWQPVSQAPNTFNITGRVTYNNLPLGGVSVNLTGSTTASTTTDAVGNYQFSGLSAGGQYTVSPSRLRYYFTPTNGFFFSLLSNQTANFDVLAVCQGNNCVRNGKIALSRDGDIFTINADGTGSTNITNNAAFDDGPNYSPDGSKIVFFTSRDGNEEIYRMDADGSNPVRLTNNTASDTVPFYSPDGASIVFQSLRDGNSEIYKMNADGTNQVRLTNNTADDSQPAFSPDGSRIVFISGNLPTLWTMGADGSNPQPISPPTGIAPFYQRPSYSPDGSKIIFTFSPDAVGAPPLLWTMNVDGSNRTAFPGQGGMWPTYSPDGRTVVYICCIFDFTQRPWTRNADGTSATILAPSLFQSRFPDWQGFQVPRPTAFDFDGDGRSDPSVFRPSTGAWYLLRSTAGLWVPVWGLSTDVLAPADYDGDLKTDVAVWRPSDGNFYILNSFNSTTRVENFGLAGDVPTGGDWDGDGKADVAVYRAGAQSVFYYRGSMGNPLGHITFVPWGITGDKPVVGDYDGDGVADVAIYRSNTWWIRNSSNGQVSAVNFGLQNDTLVPADYDGDGKTDIAVFRDGIWYQLRSAQGFAAFQFGIAGDIPTSGDYDGDGRADATVYRNGVWWLLRSQSGSVAAGPFGLASDKPIPSAFVR
ncbi:MAG: FG-GAP-like repeat-containing protein [Pyrinomonadaceae bacterium]